jgi:hypothetical protein
MSDPTPAQPDNFRRVDRRRQTTQVSGVLQSIVRKNGVDEAANTQQAHAARTVGR